jgi:hypothetical protein
VTTKVFAWNDLSPRDGCTLVRFVMLASSWKDIAHAARAVGLEKATVKDLARNGGTARQHDEIAAASSQPGTIFWLDDSVEPASWTKVPSG